MSNKKQTAVDKIKLEIEKIKALAQDKADKNSDQVTNAQTRSATAEMTEEQRKYLSKLMPSILTNTFDKLNTDKDKCLTVKKTKENFSVMTGREKIRMIG